MLRVVALWMVSLGVIVVMLTAALAAYGAQRKDRRYEHENNDSSNVAHLSVSLVRANRILATPRRRRIDAPIYCHGLWRSTPTICSQGRDDLTCGPARFA